jgi:peptidoglycan/xylan/chitin deacetylase (PgdA/CDA1 family)
MDVQLHTHTHGLGDMSAAKVAEELATNRKVLSEELGLPPSHFSHFCYPSGVYDAKAFEPLAKEGIQTATTTAFGLATATSNPLALPRILDGESMSDLALEARLSGFWFLLNRLLMRRT